MWWLFGRQRPRVGSIVVVSREGQQRDGSGRRSGSRVEFVDAQEGWTVGNQFSRMQFNLEIDIEIDIVVFGLELWKVRGWSRLNLLIGTRLERAMSLKVALHSDDGNITQHQHYYKINLSHDKSISRGAVHIQEVYCLKIIFAIASC